MNRKIWRLMGLFLLLCILLLPTATALAKEIGHLIIKGPGIDEEITFDKGEVQKLMEAGLLEGQRMANEPTSLGTSFQMLLHLDIGEGPEPWIQLDYYPQADGKQAYVRSLELIGSEDPGPHWYVMPAKAEAALLGALEGRGVALTPKGAVMMKEQEKAEIAPRAIEANVSKAAPEQPALADTGIAPFLDGWRLPLLAAGLAAAVLLLLAAARRVARSSARSA
jgi:hypothetical protein